jgi:hypothetical protein
MVEINLEDNSVILSGIAGMRDPFIVSDRSLSRSGEAILIERG